VERSFESNNPVGTQYSLAVAQAEATFCQVMAQGVRDLAEAIAHEKRSSMAQKSCLYCGKPPDGPMLVMGAYMAHVPCVIKALNELLDTDWDGAGNPCAIVTMAGWLATMKAVHHD